MLIPPAVVGADELIGELTAMPRRAQAQRTMKTVLSTVHHSRFTVHFRLKAGPSLLREKRGRPVAE